MKKISYYLAFIVFLGVAIVSFWIYQKYFKTETQSVIAFQVVRGDLREAVNVRGEVVAQKEFELEFPFGGTVERIYAKEGSAVKEGEPLMKLETKEFDFERGRLNAILSQGEATLAKLLGGAQVEDLRVSEAKVVANEQALRDAEKTLLDALNSAFTTADDAIHNKAGQFFNNPRSPNATFNQILANSQLKTNLEANIVSIEGMLTEWGKTFPLDVSRILVHSKRAQENLSLVRAFLFDLATAINGIMTTASISQTTFDGWKASVLLARTNVDSALTAIVSAEGQVKSAESSLLLAESELAFKKSKPRSEDIKIAEAQIEETKNALAVVDEKIRKSVLRAPGAGMVRKLILEEKEIFKPGMTALTFASNGLKIQADVSELDISKIRYANGSDAAIRFDAFPAKSFKGRVILVEPKEVLKNEDVYFRANIFLDASDNDEEIRSGMSADVVLYGELKKDVLMVPELVIVKRGGASLVKVATGATTKEEVDTKNITERVVTTGVSDGESVEVLTGLNQGEVVVVVAD